MGFMDMEHWGDRRRRRSRGIMDHGHGHGGIEDQRRKRSMGGSKVEGLTLPFLLYKKTLAMVPPADL
jgi:hypothetical protein